MSSKAFYYPCCPVKNCNGVLWIKYINENFSLDYECEKNEEHKGDNIYFETFEKFYLNKEEYIKKNVNNFINIKDTNNECTDHERQKNYYCIDCKTYLCKECSKVGHEGHQVKDILESIFSQNKINELIDRLKYYDKLINKIDSSLELFNVEFSKKIEKLKKEIITEKKLMEKLILNYNHKFMNYTYHLNMEEIYNYTKSFNNEYLEGFYLSDSIPEKSKYLIDCVFPPKQEKIPEIENMSTYVSEAYKYKLKKLNNEYFLNYRNSEQKFQLIKYNEKKDIFIEEEAQLTINNNIEYFFTEKYSDQIYKIYTCLSDISKVFIYECNLSENSIFQNDEEIFDEKDQDIPFNKCKALSKNGYIATYRDDAISIWKKHDPKNPKSYAKVKEIQNIYLLKDFFSVDEDYFILAFRYQVIFYDAETLNEDKEVEIDDNYFGKMNKLFLFNKFIIIVCEKGICFILIKTKELIQFLEFEKKCIKCSGLCLDNESIYALYEMKEDIYSKSEYNIVEYKMISGSLQKVKCFIPSNCSIFDSEKDNLNITCLKSKKILIIGEKTYKMSITRPREYIKDVRKSHITDSGKCVLKKKWYMVNKFNYY